MWHLDAGQVSEKDTMPVQRPLRRAGRARREDHQGGVVGRRRGRIETIAGARDRVIKVESALPCPIDREHKRQLGHLTAYLIELGKPLRVSNDGFHAGVREPVAQRVDPEQDRKRHRDRAKLVDRNMRSGCFGCLRQQHRDSVAGQDGVRRKRVGETVRIRTQRAIGDGVLRAIGADIQNGRPVRILRRPAVTNIDADVVTLEFRPAEFAVERGIVMNRWKHGAGGTLICYGVKAFSGEMCSGSPQANGDRNLPAHKERERMSKAIQIRMGGYGPSTTGFSKSLKFIGDRLASQFGDRVDVKYIWNIMDFGYRAEDILWLVEHGLLTLGYQSSSYLTDRVPELGFVDLPFLFSRRDTARAAVDGKLGQYLAGKIEERLNYRI